MKRTKLWLDDFRHPPTDEWVWAENYKRVTHLLANYEWDHVSLDHDLEPGFFGGQFGTYNGYTDDPWDDMERTGFDVVKFIVQNDTWARKTLATHTDNSHGRQNMIGLIDDYGPYSSKKWYERKTQMYPVTGVIYYADSEATESEEEDGESGELP